MSVRAPRLLLLDNYDSFTFNLVQSFQKQGAAVEVVRNDALTAPEAIERGADGIVISPGPGVPERSGISVALARAACEARVPLLGVCLGHQALAVALGGRLVHAPELVHGKARPVRHDGSGVLRGLPSPFPAGRYHSWCVDPGSLPDVLEATAWAPDGTIMALRHRTAPAEGIQFHPESVLTPVGGRLLGNFLSVCAQRRFVTRSV
ncbi:MAG: aminodeoxychorismate/anthranilate synthase component II [Planctomycetes bacterium]|nr:aminodeoxychorismate/anthranilate synthase component II [Planctomycetota bacterium]